MTPFSSPATFSCTSCQAVLSVPPAAPGTITEGPCPHCGSHLRFTHSAPPAATAASQIPPFGTPNPSSSPRQVSPYPEPQQVQSQSPRPLTPPNRPTPGGSPSAPAASVAPLAKAPTFETPSSEALVTPRSASVADDDLDYPSNPVATQLAGALPKSRYAAPHQNPRDSRTGVARRMLDMVAMVTILGLLGAIGWVGWQKFEPEIRDFVAQTGIILPSAEASPSQVASDASGGNESE